MNARHKLAAGVAATCAAIAGTVAIAPTPAEATSSIRISRIWYDSPGTDTRTNASLNGEYVIIKNYSTSARSLTSWTLRDAANHVYKFGSFTLGAGKTVVVRTGKGTNSSTTRYWGSAAYIWNNDKDTGYLRNSAGTLVHSCAYNSTAYDYKNC